MGRPPHKPSENSQDSAYRNPAPGLSSRDLVRPTDGLGAGPYQTVKPSIFQCQSDVTCPRSYSSGGHRVSSPVHCGCSRAGGPGRVSGTGRVSRGSGPDSDWQSGLTRIMPRMPTTYPANELPSALTDDAAGKTSSHAAASPDPCPSEGSGLCHGLRRGRCGGAQREGWGGFRPREKDAPGPTAQLISPVASTAEAATICQCLTGSAAPVASPVGVRARRPASPTKISSTTR